MEFPIQMGVAEMAHLRKTRPAHAPAHNNVGGYMRGERKEKQKKMRASKNWGTAGSAAPEHRHCGHCSAQLMRPVRLS